MFSAGVTSFHIFEYFPFLNSTVYLTKLKTVFLAVFLHLEYSRPQILCVPDSKSLSDLKAPLVLSARGSKKVYSP